MSKLRLVKPSLPKSSTATFKQVQKVLKMGLIPIPDERSYRGSGAPGRLLEHLLGISENNNDSPDLNDWEIKFHGGSAPVTLFHKDPEPRGIMRNLVHEHGWKDDQGRISFRHTIYGRTERGFYVVNEADRVIVRHETKDTVNPFWKHNTLLGSIGAKLRRLIVVQGKMAKQIPKAVTYQTATAYWDFDLTGFCEAVAKGKVAIDFDARTQQGAGSALRNHGTKFRIKMEDIASLYAHSKKI